MKSIVIAFFPEPWGICCRIFSALSLVQSFPFFVVGNILNRIQLKIFLLESELLDVTFYVIIIFFSYTYLFEFGVISKQISLFFASVISILLSGEPFLVAEFKIILLSEDFLLSTLWRA